MKLTTEITFSISEALLYGAKQMIALEAEELGLSEELIQRELPKVTLNLLPESIIDIDSSNLYHANAYATCEIEYSGSNQEFITAINNLEEN